MVDVEMGFPNRQINSSRFSGMSMCIWHVLEHPYMAIHSLEIKIIYKVNNVNIKLNRAKIILTQMTVADIVQNTRSIFGNRSIRQRFRVYVFINNIQNFTKIVFIFEIWILIIYN